MPEKAEFSDQQLFEASVLREILNIMDICVPQLLEQTINISDHFDDSYLWEFQEDTNCHVCPTCLQKTIGQRLGGS